jgi:hypothetical protein
MKNLLDTLRGRGEPDGGVAWLTMISACCLLGFVTLVLFAW